MAVLNDSAGAYAGPRPDGRLLTERFTVTWQDVERPLRCFLGSLGASQDHIDDVVQETAARALEREVPYVDAADLRRWCFVVARRIWVDETRRSSRTAPLECAAALHDPLAEVGLRRAEDRQLLNHVATALVQLHPADREALRSSADAMSAAERNRRNVARHRARARLRVLVGPLSGAAVLGPPIWLRRTFRTSSVVALPALAAFTALTGALPGQVDAPASQRFITATDVAAPRPAVLAASSGATEPSVSPAAVSRVFGATGGGGDRRTHPVLTVDAPGGTHLNARRDDRASGEALLCLTGDVVNMCIDVAATSPRVSPPPLLEPAFVTGRLSLTTGG